MSGNSGKIIIMIAFVLIIATFGAPLPYLKPISVVAQSASCNLVPNSTFEQGTNTSFTNWQYYTNGDTGASFVAQNYLSPGVTPSTTRVQSGARAPKLLTGSKGNSLLNSQKIRLTPGFYTLRSRFLATQGATLRISLYLFDPVTGVYLQSESGGGNYTGIGTNAWQWQSAESYFVVNHQDRDAIIQILGVTPGKEYYWDDVSMWKTTTGYRCIDARHYVTQTTAPWFRLCSSNGGVCRLGWKDRANEYVMGTIMGSNTARDHYSHGGSSATLIGIQKNYNPDETWWRCWTTPGTDQCGPTNGQNTNAPALKTPISMSLPVLSSFDPTKKGPTTNAIELLPWDRVHILDIDDLVGGTRWNRTFGFIATSIDFGGDLGVQSNVFVLEEISSNDNGGIVCNQGTRFERYYFVQGYGRVDSFGVNWAGDCGVWSTSTNGVPTANLQAYQLPDDSYNPLYGSYNVIDWW